MKNKSYKSVDVSHPKDKSLEAYKTWMREIARMLTTGNVDIQWTEEEWVANWKKFWKEKPGD